MVNSCMLLRLGQAVCARHPIQDKREHLRAVKVCQSTHERCNSQRTGRVVDCFGCLVLASTNSEKDQRSRSHSDPNPSLVTLRMLGLD